MTSSSWMLLSPLESETFEVVIEKPRVMSESNIQS